MPNKISINNPNNYRLEKGFLKNFWSSKGKDPLLSKLESLQYLFEQGVKNLFTAPASSLISTTTIIASVFLISSFLILVKNFNTLVHTRYDSFALTVYFKENSSQKEVDNVVRELSKNTYIKNVEYLSKDQAMKSFKDDFRESKGLFAGLEIDNPLPRSADVFLKSITPTEIDQVINSLTKIDTIEDYTYGSNFITAFKRIFNIFYYLTNIGIVVSIAVVIFLITNTIKLLIFSRKDEITIMQLMGAPDSLILFPFVVSGLIKGLIGAFFGLVVLKLVFSAVVFELNNFNLFSFNPLFLSNYQIIIILLMSSLIAAIASYFSVGKFLDV